MKNSASKVVLSSYDDLFGITSDTGKEQVLTVNICDLHNFKNHHFQVNDDEEMIELAESIKERGVFYLYSDIGI